MIKELEDNEILNYLMISEFNEGLTPDEFKFLLFKFRYFYRLTNGKAELLKTELEGKIREMNDNVNLHAQQMNNVLVQKSKIENEYNFLKSRKLSIKERISGKIIIKQNETQ